MGIALTSKSRAVVGAIMAIVQLAGAVTAGISFTQGDNELLFAASAAFTSVIMLINRWYFRGWRELRQARLRKRASPTFMF